MDATLKVWDVRRSKVPIAAVEDLPNRYAQTSVILSPDGDYVITGTSVVNKQGLGRLCAFETSTMTPVGSIAVSPESVIAIEVGWCAWVFGCFPFCTKSHRELGHC